MSVLHRGVQCSRSAASSSFPVCGLLPERVTPLAAARKSPTMAMTTNRIVSFANAQRQLFHNLPWHSRQSFPDSFLSRHKGAPGRSPTGFVRCAFGNRGTSPQHYRHSAKDESNSKVLGGRLRAWLQQQQGRPKRKGLLPPAPATHGTPEDVLVASWKHAEDVLETSLRDIRVLRARCERTAGEGASGSENEWIGMIRDCIRLLDRLSLSLPQAEDHSSSWLFDRNAVASSVPGPRETSVLNKSLLNELLKEWMMGWKATQQKQQQQQQHVQHQVLRGGSTTRGQPPNLNANALPSPAAMAERVDAYRSTSLIQPDSTSFNLLLHAMIRGEPDRHPRRRLAAIKLADDYLRRLVEAQSRSSSSSLPLANYFDAVSVATVMKGWVDLGQPQRAHDWLNRTRTASVPPNAVAYATVIDGWAKSRNPQKAEAVLEEALSEALGRLEFEQANGNENNENENGIIVVDRVAFHTVLDAWAASAATGGNSEASFPATRARALVEMMHDLADDHPDRLEHLRPSDETWYKLIAAVAAQPPAPRASKNPDSGPRAAEALLNKFEDDTGSHSATPAIVLNRLLRAYCASGRYMEEAEDFYQRRCEILESSSSQWLWKSSGTAAKPVSVFPDQVTFHTILGGWATAAEVAKKRDKFKSKANSKSKSKSKSTAAANAAAAKIPIRAEAWLEEMHRRSHPPSTRAYGSILQAWSLSTRCHEDAADRAEEFLKGHVWKMLEDDDDIHSAPGITICTNIVLRAWSNQIASFPTSTRVVQTSARPSGRAVGRCLRLFQDFLALTKSSSLPLLAPTAETFRAVLHAIVSPSNGMTPVQKYDHSRALLACMTDVYNIRPGPADLKKFERIESMIEHGYLQRTKQKGNTNKQKQPKQF